MTPPRSHQATTANSSSRSLVPEYSGRAPADPQQTVHGISFWRLLSVTLGITGIAIVLAGTFAPWLQSGSVDRNSYQMVALLKRFPILHSSTLQQLVGSWPLLGPALMVPAVFCAVKLWRAAGTIGAVLGILASIPSIVAFATVGSQSRFGVQLLSAGPVTVIVGAGLLVIGSLLLVAPPRHDLRLSFGCP